MIYLASPYSHENAEIREERVQVSLRIATSLLNEDMLVYSPLAFSAPLLSGMLPKSPQFWMAHCMEILACCDTILVVPMPGWRTSTGLMEEVLYAVKNRYRIACYDDDDYVAEGLIEPITKEAFSAYIASLLQFEFYSPPKGEFQ